jgi:hypothetical protein
MSLTPPPDQEPTVNRVQAIVVSVRSVITKATSIEKLPGVGKFLAIKTPDTYKVTGKHGKKELLETGQLTTEQTLEQYRAKPTASWSPAIKHSASAFSCTFRKVRKAMIKAAGGFWRSRRSSGGGICGEHSHGRGAAGKIGTCCQEQPCVRSA